MRFITPPKERPVDPSEPQRTLLVIGAGLSRCATSSLQYAFENTLGLSPAMHMAHVAPYVERLKLLTAALKETDDKIKRQALLHQLIDGYAAVSDVPGWAFVDDLMEMYPSAKVVLNKRARAEDWVRSIKTTTGWLGSKSFFAICYWNPLATWSYYCYNAEFSKLVRVLGLDSANPSVEMYEAHLNWVRGLAKARGMPLLEWMPEMGYAPLCEFLGKEIPEEPFPRLNEAKDMRSLKNYYYNRGILSWAGVVGLLVAPAVASFAWFRM